MIDLCELNKTNYYAVFVGGSYFDILHIKSIVILHFLFLVQCSCSLFGYKKE